jgi:antitoxin MazE
MRTLLRKTGNSTGMILPKPILKELGLDAGATIELKVENGCLIIAPLKRATFTTAE